MKTITRKSMLYETGVEYGDWAMNHVEGCSHGCKYPCYAYLQKKRFNVVKDYEDWCEPKLVINTLELLEKELTPRRVGKIKNVQMCFTTDPFMIGYPEVQLRSLEAIALLNSRTIPVTVLTKGLLPKPAKQFESLGLTLPECLRIDELMISIPGWFGYLHPENYYGISLVSLDERFREKWEPGSAPYADRIASLRALHDAGLRTWVSMEPCPHPGIIEQDYKALLDSIAFVDRIVFGRWNYNKEVNREPFPVLKEIDRFYTGTADFVEWYCAEHGIECIIKEGTA